MTPNPHGQIVDTTKSGGLNVRQTWQNLFEVNEQRWEDADPDEPPLTDDEIVACMATAFPDRVISKHLRAVRRVRSTFNRGALTMGDAPVYTSYRYQRDGSRIFRTTARGRKLAEWQSRKGGHGAKVRPHDSTSGAVVGADAQ